MVNNVYAHRLWQKLGYIKTQRPATFVAITRGTSFRLPQRNFDTSILMGFCPDYSKIFNTAIPNLPRGQHCSYSTRRKSFSELLKEEQVLVRFK